MFDLTWLPWDSIAAIVAALALLLSSGCATGSATRTFRSGLEAAAHGVAAADASLAVGYAHVAARELERATTREEYRASMAPWNAAETTLRALRLALVMAEAAVDVGDARTMRVAAACLHDAAIHALDALDRLGVAIPEELARSLPILLAIAGAGEVCRGS